MDELKLMNGAILSKMINLEEKNIQNIEFKVFSQFGDDGIIQYLIKKIADIPTNFIEFGVENYEESNTRFLLENNNWSGLVIDGDETNIKFIRNKANFWRYDLTAITSFVTSENINQLINTHFNTKDIGLLHIDIDGMDYWIWESIQFNPVIVIIEYNSVFGAERAITVPYQADFIRKNAHYSNLYAGASLAALYFLAQKKGYEFIGCNNAGNNAYFVRKDFTENLTIKNLAEGFVCSKFRESRSETGELTYLQGDERLKIIKKLPIFNVITNTIEDL
jgi:hypothetical protein